MIYYVYLYMIHTHKTHTHTLYFNFSQIKFKDKRIVLYYLLKDLSRIKSSVEVNWRSISELSSGKLTNC